MSQDEDFESFVRLTSARLLKDAWLLCGNPHEAEELVQTALEKVYVKWSRLADQNPYGYARRCVVSEHIDRVRRNKREGIRHQILSAGRRSAEHSRSEAVDDTDELVRLLGGLPQQERQAVILRHYADLPISEVAQMLGVSISTVKSASSRGLAKVRAQIQREERSNAI